MHDYQLMSYTVHQATYYSDAKSESSSFSSLRQQIGICNDCQLSFWKEDARSDLDPYDEKYSDLPEVKDLFDLSSMRREQFQLEKIAFFKKLVDDGFANTLDRSFYLRQQLWWAINDLVRNSIRPWQFLKMGKFSFVRAKRFVVARRQSKKEFKTFKPLFQDNLAKLADLLLKDANVDRLLLAEIYREQGKFSLAMSTLKGYTEKHGKAFSQIKRAIRWRKRGVFKMN